MEQIEQLKVMLSELHDIVRPDWTPHQFRAVQALVEQARVVAESAGRSIARPGAAIRSGGPLAIADYVSSMRRQNQPDRAIMEVMSWSDARRIRHFLALSSLSADAREVIERYGFTERQIAPMLEWRQLDHFVALMDLAGQAGFSSREVEAWAEAAGSQPTLEEARVALENTPRRGGKRIRGGGSTVDGPS